MNAESVPAPLQLPPELCTEVFSFCNWRAIARCGSVCRRWYHASRVDVLWSHVRVRLDLQEGDHGHYDAVRAAISAHRESVAVALHEATERFESAALRLEQRRRPTRSTGRDAGTELDDRRAALSRTEELAADAKALAQRTATDARRAAADVAQAKQQLVFAEGECAASAKAVAAVADSLRSAAAVASFERVVCGWVLQGAVGLPRVIVRGTQSFAALELLLAQMPAGVLHERWAPLRARLQLESDDGAYAVVQRCLAGPRSPVPPQHLPLAGAVQSLDDQCARKWCVT